MRFRPQIFINFVDHLFGIFLNNTGCVIFDIPVILSLISLISCLKKIFIAFGSFHNDFYSILLYWTYDPMTLLIMLFWL